MTEWEYGRSGAADGDVEVVQRIYAAFARRDVEAALPLIAEDCELMVPVTAQVVGRDTSYRGHAGVRQFFADAESAWDDFSVHPDNVRAAPGSVVVFGDVGGHVDGREVRRDVVWTWQLRDGLAVTLRINDLGGSGS
jgi:ketosteroid isomerase-like protein